MSSTQFYLNTLTLALQQFLPDKHAFTKNDFKIIITALFSRTPSDVEVDAIFLNNDQIPRYRIDGIVQDLVYLKRRNLSEEVFSILDIDFKGYFDENDLRKVWENVARKLDWKVVLECFRELCKDKMSFYEFAVVCKLVGLGEDNIVMGDGQSHNVILKY